MTSAQKAKTKRSPKAARPKVETSSEVPEFAPVELGDEAGGIQVDGSFAPRIIGKSGKTPKKRIDVFELDGTMYSIPEVPNAATVLQFQTDLRTVGRDVAVAKLTTTLLGDEALNRLAASPLTDEEDVAHVLGIVMKVGYEGIRRLSAKVQAVTDPS